MCRASLINANTTMPIMFFFVPFVPSVVKKLTTEGTEGTESKAMTHSAGPEHPRRIRPVRAPSNREIELRVIAEDPCGARVGDEEALLHAAINEYVAFRREVVLDRQRAGRRAERDSDVGIDRPMLAELHVSGQPQIAVAVVGLELARS